MRCTLKQLQVLAFVPIGMGLSRTLQSECAGPDGRELYWMLLRHYLCSMNGSALSESSCSTSCSRFSINSRMRMFVRAAPPGPSWRIPFWSAKTGIPTSYPISKNSELK